jgi:hypothetical protein
MVQGWLSRDWVRVSFKRKSSQGIMSTNVCSYPTSSCPHHVPFQDWLAICFALSSISYSSGICDDNQQEWRLDIEQCWGIFVVFSLSHGQLYVVISQVTSSANIKIFNSQGPDGYMRNAVYREVLEM